MQAELGRIPENLQRAERLVEEAFARGARWVALPEFFPTALEGPALQLLTGAARRHSGFVAGSFIAAREGESFNTLVLARPDGSWATHDKDIPTMWEGCYYRGGSDDGVAEAGGLRVGLAVCWEFIRWQTARRLRSRVDLVLGGSCWASMPRAPFLRGFLAREHERNVAMAREAIPAMARALGAPVVHAAHAGRFRGRMPVLPSCQVLALSFLSAPRAGATRPRCGRPRSGNRD
jgi:predicted amidohydrolase